MPCCQHPASHSSMSTSAYTEPAMVQPFPWHVLPGTLGLSWHRIYMFRAGSYIYLAPGSCLYIEKTNCLPEKKNEPAICFVSCCLYFFVSIYLLFFMACYCRAQEMIGVTSKHQIPAFLCNWAFENCPRSGGCLCQGTWAKGQSRAGALLIGADRLLFPGKRVISIQEKESCFEYCFLNESAEPSPKALEPARGKNR